MFSTPFAYMAAPAGGGYDPDAQAYIDAVIAAGGTLSSGDQDAVNTLFVDMKTAGIYSKIGAFYPVVGGIAASHSINGNLNSSFDLTFNNSFTQGASGFAATSSSSYASTNYIPLTEHSGGAMSLGVFLNTTPSTNDRYAIGAYVSATRFLSWDYLSGSVISSKYLANNRMVEINPPNLLGFVQLSSNGTNKLFSILNNGTEYTASGSKDGDTLPNIEIYISNLNVQGSPYDLQAGRICFAYMGDYLTASEMTNFGSIVDTFQTALGRNTY